MEVKRVCELLAPITSKQEAEAWAEQVWPSEEESAETGGANKHR
jgi:hypothetical protein